MTKKQLTHTIMILFFVVGGLLGSVRAALGAEDAPEAIDASVNLFRQCANDDGDGFDGNPGHCNWPNGALGINDSAYPEGDAVVQLLHIDGLTPGDTVWMDIGYATTRGGIHTYDFLTNWDWSESWITEADRCQGVSGCVDTVDSTYPIPANPAIEPAQFNPDPRIFTMRGGTLTGVTMPTITTGVFPTGNTDAQLRVSFTVASEPSPMCSGGECEVVVWWGAHVATSINWGAGFGEGSTTGNPFHVILNAWSEGGLGQMDNQMSSGVITQYPNGIITIVKKTDLPAAQAFSFNLNNGSTIAQAFTLTDNSTTADASVTYEAPPGTWVVSELNIPLEWILTGLTCSDPTNNTNTNLGAASATIDLASSETVTCTFTNTDRPTAIDFLSEPSASPGEDFVEVSWEADIDAQSSAFKLYRSESRNGTGKALLESGILGGPHSYRDSSVERGRTYFYFVEVLGNSGPQPMIMLQAEVYFVYNLRLPIVRR